ncbi:hypothetical protein PTKIN_Ptkin13bG0100600 [Pterospermum kingtungense]
MFPSAALWRDRFIVNQIENMKLQLQNWEIAHIFRESNQITDRLAKEGDGPNASQLEARSIIATRLVMDAYGLSWIGVVSAIMKNCYVLMGSSSVNGEFNKVAKVKSAENLKQEDVKSFYTDTMADSIENAIFGCLCFVIGSLCWCFIAPSDDMAIII